MSVSLGLSDPDDFLRQVGGYEECWELCRGSRRRSVDVFLSRLSAQ